MPFFERDGVSLYYEEHGEGAPLVFTHGVSLNHEKWRSQIEQFAKSHRVVVWDVRGHGSSSLPPGRVDSEDFSRDLIALLDHLGINEATLCGLSMGGHISLQSAIRYPDRVKGLILIGTPCSNTLDLYERVLVPMNRFSSRFVPMKLLGLILAAMFSRFNAENKAYIKGVVNTVPHQQWVRLWDAVTRMESKNDLHKVQCPCLLLVGEHDVLTMRHQEFMRQKIEQSSLVTIPRAHHATNLDNPEGVNAAIDVFLKNI